MKKNITLLIMTLVIVIAAVAFLAAPPQARADVGTIDFGLTNKCNVGTVTSTGMATNTVNVDQVDNVSLVFTGTIATNDATTITFTFARSYDGSTWETNPQYSWACSSFSGNTSVYFWTNLPQTVIGGAHSLKLVSTVVGLTNTVTNCVLKVVKKKVEVRAR